jgi:thiol-disulfide isomerase/thioredoxin
VIARSTPVLRSFCNEPSLKPHVHVSASKAAPLLFNASNPFAVAIRAARLHLARLVRDPSAVSQIPARSLLWHLGQASRAGDVTTTKQLLRRLMDEAVLKEAVQSASNNPLRSKKLCWSLPRTIVLTLGSCVLFTACANEQSPVVPYIRDWFFCYSCMISLLWSGREAFERLQIHERQMEYKYPEGKVLTDEEARELVRKEFEDARWVEVRDVCSWIKLKQSCSNLGKRMCVYAYSPSCEPCKAAWPQLQKRIGDWKQNSDVVFVTVDISQPGLGFTLQVESVPTLKLLDSNGNEVNSFTVTTSADTFFSSVDSTWYEIDATVRPVLFHRDEQKSQTVAKMAVHSAHGARDFLTVLHCVSCR